LGCFFYNNPVISALLGSQAPLCFCHITHVVISKPTLFSLFQLV